MERTRLLPQAVELPLKLFRLSSFGLQQQPGVAGGLAIGDLFFEQHDRLERIAIEHGVLGRGVYQGGDTPIEKRFLHLDRWTKAPPALRPRLWSGKPAYGSRTSPHETQQRLRRIERRLLRGKPAFYSGRIRRRARPGRADFVEKVIC